MIKITNHIGDNYLDFFNIILSLLIYNILKKGVLMKNFKINSLSKENSDGKYSNFFNATNNIDFKNNFVIIELDSLEHKESLQSVLLLAIANKINS